MKHRFAVVLLLISILSLLAACGKKSESGMEGELSTGYSEQSVLFGHAGSTLVVAPEGYYSLNGLVDQMYLSYISKDNAKEIYLCSKPECAHVEDKFALQGLETCNAFVGTVLPCSIAYCDGWIYVLEYNTANFEVTLVRVSADGNLHEDVMVVGQAPNQGSYYKYIFADSNTILMVYNPPDYTGESREISIEKIDLRKKEKTILYSFEDKGAFISNLKLYDEAVFFVQSVNLEEGYTYELVKCDISTGVAEVVTKENVMSYTLTEGDMLYYAVPKEGIYQYNLKNKSAKRIRACDRETMYVSLAYDGTYLYLDNVSNKLYYDENTKHCVYICDKNGKDINVIPGGQSVTELSDENYIFHMQFVRNVGNRWAYIKKENITDPNVQWETVTKAE